MRICVVILNWNGSSHTLRCVDKVLAQTVIASTLIVDNGSLAEDVRALRNGLPTRCLLLELSRNLGFAGGMNVGIKMAVREGFDYVWLLNNDAFPEPDCLAKLEAVLEADSRLALVIPSLYDPDGKEQHVGGSLNWSSGALCFFPARELMHSLAQDEWLTGTAPLIRTEALRHVGAFDEKFFAYWEDVDLCVRLQYAGWRMRAVPEGRCVHLGDHSSSGRGESPFGWHLMTRNSWLFLRKHLPRARRRRAFIGWVIYHLNYAIDRHRADMRLSCRAILRGLWAGICGETDRPKQILAPIWVRRLLTWKWKYLARLLHFIRPDLIGG